MDIDDTIKRWKFVGLELNESEKLLNALIAERERGAEKISLDAVVSQPGAEGSCGPQNARVVIISIKDDELKKGKKLRQGGKIFGSPGNSYECPNCFNFFTRYHNSNYCHACGIKIRWVE